MKIVKIVLVIFIIGVFNLNSQESYIIPDIGDPGMNIYVEFIAPIDNINYFGEDGFYLNNEDSPVRITTVENTGMIEVSPLIVSWDGRLISAHIFVSPGAEPKSSKIDENYKIELSVLVNNKSVNKYDFYIVKPQQLGDISTINEYTLGEGNLGFRSPRGAMIVDSLILAENKIYEVSEKDCDPNLQGNQGYLPIILLSKGRVVGNGSTIDISANLKDAGPGGGGGGSGATKPRSGNGFTTGGYSCAGTFGNGTYINGKSINGVAPGNSLCDQGGGGGTSHPFGRSGVEGNRIKDNPDGQYGAGSAGGEATQFTYGGGGGGNGTQGEKGEGGNNSNGGRVTGNDFLVPLHGGSGGGAGNVWNLSGFSKIGGSGGGGGGAISINSFSEINNIKIISNGGDATDGVGDMQSGGGGGSAGSILVGSKKKLSDINIELLGGQKGFKGGSKSNNGGNGGIGRLKIEGASNNINTIPNNGTIADRKGFSTDILHDFNSNKTISGTKRKNDTLELYLKEDVGKWELYKTISSKEEFWSTNIDYNNKNDTLYLVATINNQNNKNTNFTYGPRKLLSQSAANVLIKKPAICDYDYFFYPDFSDTNNLNLVSDAKLIDKSIYLTEDKKEQAGAIWYKTPVSVRDGFITTISFRFTDGFNDFQFEGSAPGADGIAFVIQNNNSQVLGREGGGIGYKGIPNSFAVELDTYKNSNPTKGHNDENGNHVAIQSNGLLKNTTDHLSNANFGINNEIEEIKIDGTIYHMMIDYGIDGNKFRVWLSNNSNLSESEPILISDNIDLHNIIDLFDNHRAFVGITSSTGTSYENHEILSWEFCANTPSKNYTIVEETFDNEINIHPNPTKEKITVKTNDHNFYNFFLMDIDGRILKSGSLNEKNNEIYLKDFAKGVYILRLINTSGNKFFDHKVLKE